MPRPPPDVSAPPEDEPEGFVGRRVRRIERHGTIDGLARSREVVLMHVARGEVDQRFESPRFIGNDALQQLNAGLILPRGHIDLPEMRQQHHVVRLLATQLLEDANRRLELPGDDVGGGVFQKRRIAAPEREHFIGPPVAPLRFASGSGGERRGPFVDPSHPRVRGSEKLQDVRIARAVGDQRLERRRRPRGVAALKGDPREADPPCAIARVDPGRTLERRLCRIDLILIKQPQTKPPLSRGVGRRQFDRSTDAAYRLVDASETTCRPRRGETTISDSSHPAWWPSGTRRERRGRPRWPGTPSRIGPIDWRRVVAGPRRRAPERSPRRFRALVCRAARPEAAIPGVRRQRTPDRQRRLRRR